MAPTFSTLNVFLHRISYHTFASSCNTYVEIFFKRPFLCSFHLFTTSWSIYASLFFLRLISPSPTDPISFPSDHFIRHSLLTHSLSLTLSHLLHTQPLTHSLVSHSHSLIRSPNHSLTHTLIHPQPVHTYSCIPPWSRTPCCRFSRDRKRSPSAWGSQSL